MCGIAGFLQFTDNDAFNRPAEQVISDMLETIRHRGPDDTGISFYGYGVGHERNKVKVYNDSPSKLVLGHQRLSILDLSIKGWQPMRSDNGRFEVVFNGEIYNYKELKTELADYPYASETDTEVLLAAYQTWGPKMLDKLDGMFAFALWDNEKQELFCARDPIGIKPFYYHISNEAFIFGSEPRTILSALETTGSINTGSATQFLIMGLSDHGDNTFYNEVKQLKGGHYVQVTRKGNFKPVRYWKASEKINPDLNLEYSELYYHKVSTAVRRQLRSDVSLGTSLSGGIDSGTIVTVAGELLENQSSHYNTLTFTFPGMPNDESTNAQILADSAGMKWHPVRPSEETLAQDLEKMMVAMGEPFTTLSMFAQYKVMEHAANLGLKVMLDGQGGDEVYLGYPRVAQQIQLEYLKQGKAGAFLRELKGFRENASVPVFRSLLSNIYFNFPFLYLKRNQYYFEQFIDKDFLNFSDKQLYDDRLKYKNVYEKQNDELTKYVLPRLLRYADRNSMAFGIESRVPHLSQVIIDFALTVPKEWRVHNGWTKYMVRKAMQGRIPENVLWDKHKKGFDIPQAYWVEVLTPFLNKMINQLPASSPFKKEAILKELAGSQKGAHNFWRILSLVSWMQLMKVDN